MDHTIILSVKGMVCKRCIITIRTALEKLGVQVKDIHLGHVELYTPPEFSLKNVTAAIECLGFEILIHKHEKMVATVKDIVNEILLGNHDSDLKLSSWVRQKTKSSYALVSSIFSANEGITLEHYVINKKIDRVKYLLTETQLSITAISFQTNYSSVQHLSRQFKSKVGLNPSEYRAQLYKSPQHTSLTENN